MVFNTSGRGQCPVDFIGGDGAVHVACIGCVGEASAIIDLMFEEVKRILKAGVKQDVGNPKII